MVACTLACRGRVICVLHVWLFGALDTESSEEVSMGGAEASERRSRRWSITGSCKPQGGNASSEASEKLKKNKLVAGLVKAHKKKAAMDGALAQSLGGLG